MRIQALATDYDGTIASNSSVAPETLASLEAVRKSGRRLLLVTGRRLDDLQTVMEDLPIFDAVVAENGALLYDPHEQTTTMLAEPPPKAFLQALQRRNVPAEAGQVIVATSEPYEEQVLETIRELGIEWEVIFNKGSVMTLPSGVNKASGLRAALRRWALSPHNVAGIGDGENDHSFLRICEVTAATGNAVPALKERAQLVMQHADGCGVREFIEDYLLDGFASTPALFERYQIDLGQRQTGEPQRVPVYDANVLIVGSSGSGKSTLAGVFVQGLIDQGYPVCIVDPEGDYSGLEGLVVLGSPRARPALEEVELALRRASSGVVINLVSLDLAEKRRFSANLLSTVLSTKASLGRPTWLIIDEAHHLLPASGSPGAAVVPSDAEGICFVTTGAALLAESALQTVTHLYIVGSDAGKQVRDFAKARAIDAAHVSADKTNLLEGEALVLTIDQEHMGTPHRFRVSERRGQHQRHVRKYAAGDLGPDRSFYFRGPDGRLNLRAYNVHAFVEMARGVDLDTWRYHLGRGEISSWFRDAVKDPELARSIDAATAQAPTLEAGRDAALTLIGSRYTAAE